MSGKYRKIIINPYDGQKEEDQGQDAIHQDAVIRFQFNQQSHIDIKMIDTREAKQKKRASRTLEITSHVAMTGFHGLKIKLLKRDFIHLEIHGESDL